MCHRRQLLLPLVLYRNEHKPRGQPANKRRRQNQMAEGTGTFMGPSQRQWRLQDCKLEESNQNLRAKNTKRPEMSQGSQQLTDNLSHFNFLATKNRPVLPKWVLIWPKGINIRFFSIINRGAPAVQHGN